MLSSILIDYLLFFTLVLLFLGPPIYLWIKWIKNAIKSRNKVALIVSFFSFLLFISSFIIVWFGSERAFEHNSIKPTNTGAHSFILLLIALAIPPIYFYAEWLYQAIKSKNKLSTVIRLSYALLFVSVIMPDYINTILGHPYAYVVTGFTIFFILFATFKKSSQELAFSPNSLPYIFQYEKYDAAWTRKRSGYFILPNGLLYNYNYSRKGNLKENYINNQNTKLSEMVEDYKMEDEVIPERLYNCIDKSSKSWFSKLSTFRIINATILDELINSELEYEDIGCDMGMKTKFIWIYDIKTQKYHRITLIGKGDYSVLNKSPYTKLALSFF